MNGVKIVEYETKHAEGISKIIIRNLIEIHSKEYGMEKVEEMSKGVTPEELKKTLSKRKKVYVAIIDEEIVGTGGIEELSNTDDKTYMLATFIKPEDHNKDIERALIEKIEEDTKKLSIKKLIIPASIETKEFYYELGYRYNDENKEIYQDNIYMMEKSF